MEFSLPLSTEIVFKLNSKVTSNNDRKVPFRISSCMRSEILSVIVNAIRCLFDDSVNIARPTIVSSRLEVYFLHYSRIH